MIASKAFARRASLKNETFMFCCSFDFKLTEKGTIQVSHWEYKKKSFPTAPPLSSADNIVLCFLFRLLFIMIQINIYLLLRFLMYKSVVKWSYDTFPFCRTAFNMSFRFGFFGTIEIFKNQ